jgi:hypothetical protein
MHHAVDPMEASRGRTLGRKSEEADDAVDVEEEERLLFAVWRQLFYGVFTGE